MKNTTQKAIKKICKVCGSIKTQAHPSVEEYISNMFYVKIPFTKFKLMLFTEQIEMHCAECYFELELSKQKDRDEEVYYFGKKDGYNKAMEENSGCFRGGIIGG